MRTSPSGLCRLRRSAAICHSVREPAGLCHARCQLKAESIAVGWTSCPSRLSKIPGAFWDSLLGVCRGDLSSRPSARLSIVDHAEDGTAAVAGAVRADCGGVDEQVVVVPVGVEAATGGAGLRRLAAQPMALLPVSRLLVRTKLAYSPLTAAVGARVAAEGVAGQVDRRVQVPAAGTYGPAAIWIRGAGACWGGAFPSLRGAVLSSSSRFSWLSVSAIFSLGLCYIR
jgi:hypothetical protein